MRMAVSRPIPREAPVTRAHLPRRSSVIFGSMSGRVYAMAVEVTLYTRRPCFLCDKAKASIRAATSLHRLPIDLREVDVDGDAALRERFTNDVGAIGEEEGHHPDIYLAWGKVRVTIWTHKVDGLTRSDFVLAAKIERGFGV